MKIHYTFQLKRLVALSHVSFAILVACANPQQIDRAKYDTLLLTLQADRSQVRAGETVHMRFTIANEGNHTWVIESSDTPVLDITVRDFNSKQLLHSWAAQNPDKISHRVEWKPGEVKVLELVWTALTESPYVPGQRVHLSGALNENGSLRQAASVDVCVGSGCQ